MLRKRCAILVRAAAFFAAFVFSFLLPFTSDKAFSIVCFWSSLTKNIKGFAKLVENPTSVLFDITAIKYTFRDKYNKVIPSSKEKKRFSERLQRDNIDIGNILDFWSNYTWLMSNMLIFIIPMASFLWVYESVTRYPDEGRELGIKFQNLEVYKHQKPILNHLERYIYSPIRFSL